MDQEDSRQHSLDERGGSTFRHTFPPSISFISLHLFIEKISYLVRLSELLYLPSPLSACLQVCPLNKDSSLHM